MSWSRSNIGYWHCEIGCGCFLVLVVLWLASMAWAVSYFGGGR